MYSCQQKSYVAGYLPTAHLAPLLAYVQVPDVSRKVYLMVNSVTDPPRTLYNTIPGPAYNVTRDKAHADATQLDAVPWRNYTNIWDTPDADTHVAEDFPNVMELLRGCVHVTVAAHEYGSGSVEDVLLDMFAWLDVKAASDAACVSSPAPASVPCTA